MIQDACLKITYLYYFIRTRHWFKHHICPHHMYKLGVIIHHSPHLTYSSSSLRHCFDLSKECPDPVLIVFCSFVTVECHSVWHSPCWLLLLGFCPKLLKPHTLIIESFLCTTFHLANSLSAFKNKWSVREFIYTKWWSM